MKARILFVDDEQRILEGLERMLYPFLDRWDMVFVNSGEAALTQLQTEHFDVIVSDMKMPGMDGATLLARVQDLHPEVVRIVLSGHTELETTIRTLPTAHQYLAKPCSAQLLLETISRTCNLRKILNDDNIRSMIRKVDRLPSRPKVYVELTQALADPGISIQNISQIIEQDVGMSAKLLQLANSAFFGIPQKTTSIHQAVMYIGTSLLKHIVLSFEIFQTFNHIKEIHNFSLEIEQKHALLVAGIARDLLKDQKQSEAAFTIALLHDVGRLILASNEPEHLAQMIALSQEEGRPLYDIEAEDLGVTHAAIGAYLLTLWGLPDLIVEAVAYHHTPWTVQHPGFSPLDATYIANFLAYEQTGEAYGCRPKDIDTQYIKQLNVTDRLPLWREIASKKFSMLPFFSK